MFTGYESMSATTGLLASTPVITFADFNLGEEAGPDYVRKWFDGQVLFCELKALVIADMDHQKEASSKPKDVGTSETPRNCKLGGNSFSPHVTLDRESGDFALPAAEVLDFLVTGRGDHYIQQWATSNYASGHAYRQT